MTIPTITLVNISISTFNLAQFLGILPTSAYMTQLQHFLLTSRDRNPERTLNMWYRDKDTFSLKKTDKTCTIWEQWHSAFCHLWNYLAKSSVSLDSGEHLSVNNPRNNSWKQEKRQPTSTGGEKSIFKHTQLSRTLVCFLFLISGFLDFERTVTVHACLTCFTIIYVVIHSIQHLLIEFNGFVGHHLLTFIFSQT